MAYDKFIHEELQKNLRQQLERIKNGYTPFTEMSASTKTKISSDYKAKRTSKEEKNIYEQKIEELTKEVERRKNENKAVVDKCRELLLENDSLRTKLLRFEKKEKIGANIKSMPKTLYDRFINWLNN